jgi:hypothetical protein
MTPEETIEADAIRRSGIPMPEWLAVDQCVRNHYRHAAQEAAAKDAEIAEVVAANLRWSKKCANMLAENVQQRAEIATIGQAFQQLLTTAAESATEATLLRDELFALKHDIDSYITINAELATENVRLRAVLETLSQADGTKAKVRAIARAALAPSPPPCDTEGV